MSSEASQIIRPKPRRPFTTSPGPSEPSSPHSEFTGTAGDAGYDDPAASMERTRSVLNLTASTLYGIYAPDDDASIFGYTPMPTNGATTPAYPSTPSLLQQSRAFDELSRAQRERDRAYDRMAPVIGAMEQPQFRATPAYQRNQAQGSSLTRAIKGLTRAALLAALGVAYGTVVTHLHDERDVAPVKLSGLDRNSPRYALFWGLAGIVLGTALPVVDAIWAGERLEEKRERLLLQKGNNSDRRASDGAESNTGNPLAEAIGLGAEWNPMVRSIGAFVGIGFAIRRLPWQSTLQASLTLGLVNPCLWYTIDRSLPGFALSAAVGLIGTVVLLGTEVVPMPAIVQSAARAGNATGAAMRSAATGAASTSASELAAEQLVLGVDQGTIAVWVWIASVLFCSSLCFGNIGRRLALGVNER